MLCGCLHFGLDTRISEVARRRDEGRGTDQMCYDAAAQPADAERLLHAELAQLCDGEALDLFQNTTNRVAKFGVCWPVERTVTTGRQVRQNPPRKVTEARVNKESKSTFLPSKRKEADIDLKVRFDVKSDNIENERSPETANQK